MQRTKLVQPEDEVSGELLFSAAAIYFVGNSDGENEGAAVGGSETGAPLVSLSWKMSALREVHRRWYQVGRIGGGLGGLQFNRPLQACTGFGKRMTHRKWITGQKWLHWLVWPSAALFSISSREFSCRTRYFVFRSIKGGKLLVHFSCPWFVDGSRRGLDCNLNEGRTEAEDQYGKRECYVVVIEGDCVIDATENRIEPF